MQWLDEELQQEVSDPAARLPIDQSNVRLFYTVNPREPKFFPLSLLATAKIFYAAGESWTFSSDYYDVTNYGLFSGDDRAAGLISARLRDSMHKLGANTLVLGECGHGYNANRWEAPEWLATAYDFEVKSILEIIADYIRQGRIKLDPSRNQKRVTLHDPCNLVRLGGIIEEQRFILKRAVSDFVEMYPNREQNFCCGGGGGQLSMTRFAKRRLESGKIKADQIRATGAKIVVAPCHNCIDQLSELNKEYKLGVEIKTVSEMVAEALVINKRELLIQRIKTSRSRILSAACVMRAISSHGIDRGVNILVGIEWTDAESNRAVNLVGADLLVHERCAVQSGAARNTVVNIEHRAGICGFQTIDIERQHSRYDWSDHPDNSSITPSICRRPSRSFFRSRVSRA